jgi:hypothetical protein
MYSATHSARFFAVQAHLSLVIFALPPISSVYATNGPLLQIIDGAPGFPKQTSSHDDLGRLKNMKCPPVQTNVATEFLHLLTALGWRMVAIPAFFQSEASELRLPAGPRDWKRPELPLNRQIKESMIQIRKEFFDTRGNVFKIIGQVRSNRVKLEECPDHDDNRNPHSGNISRSYTQGR